MEFDESEMPHELDGSDLKENASTPALHTTSYSTADEKMVSMRSEPNLPVDQTLADDASAKTADDAVSLQSTSSRSFFRPPSLRRRATDRSSMTKDRPRRASDAISESESGGLNFEVEQELQKQGKEGGEWGIGDEARMSLE